LTCFRTPTSHSAAAGSLKGFALQVGASAYSVLYDSLTGGERRCAD
jgi:hypothetical protein